MNKFPALDLYRGLLTLVAGLIVVGGFLAALSLSQQSDYVYGSQFNLGVFVVVFGGSLISALGILITGELIKVFLRIEDHLDSLRRLEERAAHINRQADGSGASRGGSHSESRASLSNLGTFEPPSED